MVYVKRDAAGEIEPNLLSGKGQATSKSEFHSMAQVVEPMEGTRYVKDTAYTNDIEQKLDRSTVLNK